MNNGKCTASHLGEYYEALFLIVLVITWDFICIQAEPNTRLFLDRSEECN